MTRNIKLPFNSKEASKVGECLLKTMLVRDENDKPTEKQEDEARMLFHCINNFAYDAQNKNIIEFDKKVGDSIDRLIAGKYDGILKKPLERMQEKTKDLIEQMDKNFNINTARLGERSEQWEIEQAYKGLNHFKDWLERVIPNTPEAYEKLDKNAGRKENYRYQEYIEVCLQIYEKAWGKSVDQYFGSSEHSKKQVVKEINKYLLACRVIKIGDEDAYKRYINEYVKQGRTQKQEATDLIEEYFKKEP